MAFHRTAGVVMLTGALLAQPAWAERADRQAAAMAAVPQQFSGAPQGAQPAAHGLTEGVWWQDFGVAELDGIVRQSLQANPDLQSAQRQLAQAQVLAAQGLAPLLPSVALSASLSGQPIEAQTFFFDFPIGDVSGNVWTGNAGINASWGVDLWGANLLNFLAGRQDALAAAESTEAQQLAMTTAVVGAVFDVVYHRSRLEMIAAQEEQAAALLELTELRYSRGESTSLAVLQQRQQMQTVQALRPQGRALLRIAEMQLAVLLGQDPMSPPTFSLQALPELSPTPDVGNPTALLARSPSVQAAQAQLQAAEHRRRAALRLTLPQVALSAAYGPQYRYEADGLLWSDFDTDVKSGAFWSAGGQVSWPIFNGGQAYFTYQAAVAGADAAGHALESAVLAAIQQVEAALVLEEERALQRTAVNAQRSAAVDALQAAQDQYQTGQSNYLPVLTAQQALVQAELTALQAHRDHIDARIQLYAALGAASSTQGNTP